MHTGHGVYISRIEEGSVAERAGLRPGDTILEVNGTPFTKLTHEEALKVIFYKDLLLKYMQKKNYSIQHFNLHLKKTIPFASGTKIYINIFSNNLMVFNIYFFY